MRKPWYLMPVSSVMSQNGEFQNGCFKKTKHAKFYEKQTSLIPDAHTYMCLSGGKKCSFFGKVGVLCFLETPVLRFTLLAYYWRYIIIFICVIWYHLYNFKNVKNTYGEVTLRKVADWSLQQPATLLKVTLLHGCFPPF